MAFSTILRQLRRNNHMTQEELAEKLGLTPQAVSRWENDMAFPDVSMVRRLAYLFGVSTDTLLEVDVSAKDDHIREIVRWAEQSETVEARQILRDALSKYPDNRTLMQALLWALVNRELPGDKENKAWYTEAIEKAEYLHNHGINQTYYLLNLYRDTGNIEKGKALLDSLPGYKDDILMREDAQAQLAAGAERIGLLRQNAYTFLDKLNWTIYLLCVEDDLPEEERIGMMEAMMAADRCLLEKDTPDLYCGTPLHLPWQLARRYSEAGKTEEALRWLEGMRDACTTDRTVTLTSPAFAGTELTEWGFWNKAWMLDVLSDSSFHNLREDERFQRICAELREAVE